MTPDYQLWAEVLTNRQWRTRYEQYVDETERQIQSLLQFHVNVPKEGTNNGGSSEALSLCNLPFVVKDNIAVKGFNLTCASRMLEDFPAPYSATAVMRLQKAGAVVVGKTNMDEFAMGSSTADSAFAKTFNPWDLARVPGGSSGGTAAAVAAGLAPFGLGSDTGGSVRQPAAFCGIYGLKPTYGSISRYGLVSYASSLETIGVMSHSIEILRAAFETMRGADSLDQTSVDPPTSNSSGRAPSAAKPVLRIGVPTISQTVAPEIAHSYKQVVEQLRSLGHTTTSIELPLLEYMTPAYYTIATAEASANLARYNSIRYGRTFDSDDALEQAVSRSRSQRFGPEVQLRILLGTYVLRAGFRQRFYQRAQTIRSAIRQGFEALLRQTDMILLPVSPTVAFAHGSKGLDSFQQKEADCFTCIANLAGLPALSFPAAMANGLPVGMQLMAPAFGEHMLFDVAQAYRNCFLPPVPPKFPGIFNGHSEPSQEPR